MHITGPAGLLEAELLQAPLEKTITAILCHPHPQYGGSMHDAVLGTTSDVLLANGVNCLRFNFRGVGASEGRFDDAVGEQQDLQAVVDWVQYEYPRDALWLVGYSFGAHVISLALANEVINPTPKRTFLIAPPNGVMNETRQFDGLEKTTFIAGSQDNFCDISQLPGEPLIIEGADHFFSGQHDELAETVQASLSPE